MINKKVINIEIDGLTNNELYLKPGQTLNVLSQRTGIEINILKDILEANNLHISKKPHYAIIGNFSSKNPLLIKLSDSIANKQAALREAKIKQEENKKHAFWCVKRAEEYMEVGDYRNALNSFMSDMNKNDFTRGKIEGDFMTMMYLSLAATKNPDPRTVKKFIWGFFSGPDWDNLYENRMRYGIPKEEPRRKEEKIIAFQEKIFSMPKRF